MLNKPCPSCPTPPELCSHPAKKGFSSTSFSLKSCSPFLAQVKCNPSPLLVKLSPLSQAKMHLTLLPADVHYLNFCYSSEHILPCIVSYVQVRISPLEDWSFRTAQSRNMLSLKSKAVSYDHPYPQGRGVYHTTCNAGVTFLPILPKRKEKLWPHTPARGRMESHTQVCATLEMLLFTRELGAQRMSSANLYPFFTSQFNHHLLCLPFSTSAQNFIFGPLYSLE